MLTQTKYKAQKFLPIKEIYGLSILRINKNSQKTDTCSLTILLLRLYCAVCFALYKTCSNGVISQTELLPQSKHR